MKVFTNLRSLFVLSFLLLAATSLISCGSARTVAIEEGWELLAEQKVNFVRDKDAIDVTSRNQFTAIKFRVQDKDVRINELTIFFDNGDKLEPSLDAIIAAGEESKIIELGREGRNIDRIEFKYRSTGNLLDGRANVLIFGKRFNQYRD
ncbi:MAG TPA: hypothetical protein VGE66_17505 [Chitinophagaceae bacterium]